MSNSEPEIVGDKLRNAILVVWLASKFDKNTSKSELRRITSYDSSGLYSAIEAGWFKEEQDRLVLTDKAIIYLRKNLVEQRTLSRMLLAILGFFPMMNFADWYMLTFLNVKVIYNPIASIASASLFLIVAFNWYRLEWWTLRRKAN